MSNGIDCDVTVSAHQAQQLVSAGYSFVGRYYGSSKAQPLTKSEAITLSAAGLYVVSVWESGSPTDASYFSHDKGVSDGQVAYNYAMSEIGQPNGTPVYFAVDYDASDADISGPITQYFQGVRSAFANGTGNPSHRYFIGVYGSGLTCSQLIADGFVSYAWLAQAGGWAGSGFTGWNIKQGPSETVCGIAGDTDETNLHGGGWQITS